MKSKTSTALVPSKQTVLSPQQQGWLKMTDAKNVLWKDMQETELDIQIQVKAALKITKPTEENLAKINEYLKTAKEKYSASKGARLSFTNIIKEKIVDAAMEFEKRNEIGINDIQIHELKIRKLVEEGNKEGNDKATEISNFKAFIKTEYYRQAARFRIMLGTLVTEAYTDALKRKDPVRSIPKLIESVTQILKDEKLPLFDKFPLKLINKEEAAKIFAEVPKYDKADDVIKAINALNNQFAMYESDLKKPKPALAKASEQLSNFTKKQNDALEVEEATHKLVAQSEVSTRSGGSKVKRKRKIKFENNFEWMSAVLINAVRYLGDVQARMGRVKDISNTSVSQLAEYLSIFYNESEEKPEFRGLTMEVIEK